MDGMNEMGNQMNQSKAAGSRIVSGHFLEPGPGEKRENTSGVPPRGVVCVNCGGRSDPDEFWIGPDKCPGKPAAPVDVSFRVHMLNDSGKAKAKRIAESFNALLASLGEVVPAGRELALVKTKLEEACFFAKKGMASQPENHEP